MDINLNDQLTYLEETKEQIKQALIQKGSSISDQDTFRSFVQKINNISTMDNIFDRVDIVTINDIGNNNLELSTTDFINIWNINIEDIEKDDIIAVKVQNISSKKQGIKLFRFNKTENNIVYLDLEYNWLSYYENSMDATATSEDIAINKTAYSGGEKITGTVPIVNLLSIPEEDIEYKSAFGDRVFLLDYHINNKTILDSNSIIRTDPENIANVVNLTPNILKEGVTVLNITGTFEGKENLDTELDTQANLLNIQTTNLANINNLLNNIYSSDVNVVTADGNITNMDVLAGKIGYANGQRIVGSLSTIEFMMPNGLQLGNSTAQNLDLTTWNTSQVSNATSIFTNCQNLINLNISTWNTDNFVSLHETFYNCIRITNLNLINWNIGKVTDLHSTFANCKNLTDLSINTWNTSNVTDLVTTFANCHKLVNFEFLKDWNTSNVIDMGWTFFIVRNAKNLPISNWDVSNVSRFAGTFWFDQQISDMDLSKWNISNAITVNDMFHGCTGLININLSNWYSSKLTNMGMMFNLCNKLSDESIDSIINMCLNAVSVTYKTLYTNNQYSPFNGTNITNDRYQNRWAELDAAGWIY